jgi:uncharacterized membrane protein
MLFIPNSFYIVTDLFHLQGSRGVPAWFDLLLIFSFAWNALLMGLISVRQMEKLAAGLWPGYRSPFLLYPVMCLIALGVYLGRFLRFNSWDILVHPFSLSREMLGLLHHPLVNKDAWAMVLFYSIFLTLLYRMVPKAGQVIG